MCWRGLGACTDLSTLFLWPVFKGVFRGGVLARKTGKASGWRTGLCWPPNVFQVSVAFITPSAQSGSPVEEAVIWVAEPGEQVPGTPSLGPHGESDSPAAVPRAHPEPSPSRLLGLELFLGERWMRQGSE